MSWDSIMDQAAADIAAAAWGPATYYPVVGDPVDCRAKKAVETVERIPGNEFATWEQATTIKALLSEIGSEPEVGSHFDVGGTMYSVAEVLENDGRVVKVQV